MVSSNLPPPDESPVTRDAALKFLQFHTKWVSDCLRDKKHAGWAPFLAAIVITAEGNEDIAAFAIATPFNTPQEKRKTLRALAASIYHTGSVPVMACMVAECWLSKGHGEIPTTPPSEDPNRIEAITVNVLSLDTKHSLGTHMPFSRDADDDIVPGDFEETHEISHPALLKYFFSAYARKACRELPPQSWERERGEGTT